MFDKVLIIDCTFMYGEIAYQLCLGKLNTYVCINYIINLTDSSKNQTEVRYYNIDIFLNIICVIL